MASYFPYLSATGPAPTAREIYIKYSQAFQRQVSDGVRRPLVFPYNFFGIFLVITYLCIPHKQNPVIYAARWPLIGLVTWVELRSLYETSGSGLSLGYIAGLISAEVIMLSWTWLILNRPQWDAKRVQRIRARASKDIKEAPLSEKYVLNEKASQRETCESVAISRGSLNGNKAESVDTYEYYWQSYPDNLRERIPWVIDLVTTSRGIGWNWSISSVPKLTPELLSNFESPILIEPYNEISQAGKNHFNDSRKDIVKSTFLIIFCYIVLDVLRTVMMRDPYFKFGPTTYDLPPHLQPLHPLALQFYRLLITAISVGMGITLSFSQIRIFMSYILGPKILGLRGEPCYYPKVWGSFSSILEKGLGGLWGTFWHQTHRLHFSSPTKYLIREGYIKAGSYVARVTGLFFAFAISGFLHWAGSMTSFPDTYPFYVVLFFLLQGVGIIIQDGFSMIFSQVITRLPNSIRHTGNLIFSLTWLYLTGRLAADDFGRSGVWLIEALPFSPMQALGFGEHDASGNCWKTIKLGWHQGKHWFESGIDLI